jgi:hypothetical protein
MELKLTGSDTTGRILRTEATAGWGGINLMDHETRSEFEHFCALAEIEQDPDKFLEIKRNFVCILDEKEVRLNRQRPASRVRYPTAPSNVA